MNKRLKKSLKGKCIFIDIDGTLAEYRYNGHVSAKDGTVKPNMRVYGSVGLLSPLLNCRTKSYGLRKIAREFILMVCSGLCQMNTGTRLLNTLLTTHLLMNKTMPVFHFIPGHL